MNITTAERTQVFAKEVKAASIAGSGHGSCVLVEASNFPQLPEGIKVKVKALSFSKLQAGDFILASVSGQSKALRFLKVRVSSGITKLLVTDSQGTEFAIPFPCLLGQVVGVRHKGKSVNPNPTGYFQRLAFQLRHRFSKKAA